MKPTSDPARNGATHSTSDPVAAPAPSSVVGQVADVDDTGRPSVIYPGNQVVPVAARMLANAGLESLDEIVGASVLLVFENDDATRPIITGVVRDTVSRPREINFEAEDEVTFRCGKSAIVLRRDGTVLIRGTHVVSRSSGANRISGASISLN